MQAISYLTSIAIRNLYQGMLGGFLDDAFALAAYSLRVELGKCSTLWWLGVGQGKSSATQTSLGSKTNDLVLLA